MKIALQMYSIRQVISDEKSLIEALKAVKAMGYDGVEFAGYFGADPDVLKKALDEIGLEVVGSHDAYALLKDNVDGAIDYAKRIGNKNITLPGAPIGTLEEIEETCRVIKAAKACLLYTSRCV